MFLDESGTHDNSPCLIVAGFAIHEHDAYHLQKAISKLLEKYLVPLGLNPRDYELHGNEIKNPEGKKHKYSPWRSVDYETRRTIMSEAYRTLANFHPQNQALPMAGFGVIVDKKKFSRSIEREELAYELILNKFDAMLARLYRETNERQRGLVIHDERVVAEKDIQDWTDSWRQAAGRVGQLNNFAEVPLFADSRATRLLQAADLFAYSLWRYYGLTPPHDQYARNLWHVFDNTGREMHGLIHMTPDFAKGTCDCPPCSNRINNGALARLNRNWKPNGSTVTSDDLQRLKDYFKGP